MDDTSEPPQPVTVPFKIRMVNIAHGYERDAVVVIQAHTEAEALAVAQKCDVMATCTIEAQPDLAAPVPAQPRPDRPCVLCDFPVPTTVFGQPCCASHIGQYGFFMLQETLRQKLGASPA